MAVSTAKSHASDDTAGEQAATQLPGRLRILVGIATAGRQLILAETLRELSRQTRLPDRLVICPASSDDVDLTILPGLAYPTTIVLGERGSAHQRNAILRTVYGFDVMVFFDDDFFPCTDYLANVEALLNSQPDVVVATGQVIEDGIHGPGLTPDYARKRLALAKLSAADPHVTTCYGAYGCNMVIRIQPVLDHRIIFDEMLPLYAWQEDTDFSRQLSPYGKIVQSRALVGVHLGAKVGRTSGVRFGYSQIANPIYLIRKGTLSAPRGIRLMLKNVLANAARALRSEPHVDRLGRLKGNLIAVQDLFRGRLHPKAILSLHQ